MLYHVVPAAAAEGCIALTEVLETEPLVVTN